MKDMLTVTIDSVLLQKFREVAEEKSINKSLLISKFITQWLKENPSLEVEKVDE